jgi:hypothetical protein
MSMKVLPAKVVGAVFALLLLGSFDVFGQTSPSRPDGQLLKKPADFAKWEVIYTYAKSDAPGTRPSAPGDLKSLVTTKTGNIVHEQATDLQGRITDTWHTGATQYRKPPGEAVWYQPVPPSEGQGGSSDYAPIPPNGYRQWDWVGESTFVGTFPFDNVACLVFVPGGRSAVGEEDEKKAAAKIGAMPVVAYVNAETRLPVALRMGNITGRVTFHPSPASAQVLPTDLIDQLRNAEQSRKNLFQQPARPF